MTVDLIKAVHKNFPNNKINLFDVSWGSILAANASLQVPELLNRVVVYGQIIKNLFFNNEVFDNINSSNLNNKEREKLIILKSKNDLCKDDIQTIAGLIKKYTEGYQAKDGGKMPITKILWGLLTSPDYSIYKYIYPY